MQGGTSASSPTGLTHLPSEAKLASGKQESSTKKSVRRGPKKLNKVGRRYQLARELKQLVPWLGKASVPRLAWIVRHVADAGWTALEVQAAAEQLPVSADDARRPSGLLAYRLASCHLLYTTPERRKVMRLAWQESRAAEQARHTGYDALTAGERRPATVNVRDLIAEAFRRTRDIANRQHTPVDEEPLFEVPVDGDGQAPDLDLMDLDPTWVMQVRADAEADLDSIVVALASGMRETDARRLYTNRLVDKALTAERRAQLAPAF